MRIIGGGWHGHGFGDGVAEFFGRARGTWAPRIPLVTRGLFECGENGPSVGTSHGTARGKIYSKKRSESRAHNP